jgi:hypothetical protein
MRRAICLSLAMALAGLSPWAHAQDPKAEIQRKLNTLFVLTKTTDDKTDIVKPGSVLDLHKDGLVMYSIETKVAPTSTYKDGRFSMGFAATFSSDFALGQVQQGLNHLTVTQRKFVDGEKFWVTGFVVKDDGVTFAFYSDPYADVRYFGQVKFPFSKKSVPAADDFVKTVTEVVTAESTEEEKPSASQQPVSPPVNLPMTPVAPPPPPADVAPAPTKTISLGQTKAQVVAILGQPTKIGSIGTKEVDYYPDMKVIFIKGVVTDVQ